MSVPAPIGVTSEIVGAVESMVTTSADEALDVFPAVSVSLNVIEFDPLARVPVVSENTDEAQVALLPEETPSSYSWTVFPSVHAPVKVGVVSDVMSSEFDVPLSVASVMLGAPLVVGAVVSMVTERAEEREAEVFPATSVCSAVISIPPLRVAEVIVTEELVQVPV